MNTKGVGVNLYLALIIELVLGIIIGILIYNYLFPRHVTDQLCLAFLSFPYIAFVLYSTRAQVALF
jgi:hypothetical protein